MSWMRLHRESEGLASEAHDAVLHGDKDRAAELFEQAARAENEALALLGSEKPRTLGIIAVSTAALWFKAGRLKHAEEVALRASSLKGMPAFAVEQLKDLLQAVWDRQAHDASSSGTRGATDERREELGRNRATFDKLRTLPVFADIDDRSIDRDFNGLGSTRRAMYALMNRAWIGAGAGHSELPGSDPASRGVGRA